MNHREKPADNISASARVTQFYPLCNNIILIDPLLHLPTTHRRSAHRLDSYGRHLPAAHRRSIQKMTLSIPTASVSSPGTKLNGHPIQDWVTI